MRDELVRSKNNALPYKNFSIRRELVVRIGCEYHVVIPVSESKQQVHRRQSHSCVIHIIVRQRFEDFRITAIHIFLAGEWIARTSDHITDPGRVSGTTERQVRLELSTGASLPIYIMCV